MSADPKDAAQQAAAELEERKSQFEYANGGVGSFRLDQGAGAGIIERHIEGRCFDPAHAQWTEFMDKHPGMCCGYCAQAIDAALERAKAAEHEAGVAIKWSNRRHAEMLAAEQRAEEAERDAQHMAERYQDLGRESHEEHERIDVALGIPEDANRPRTVEVTLKAIAELRRERDEATAKLEKAQRAIWHMRYRNHEFSIGCAGCMDAETTLAALDSQPK